MHIINIISEYKTGIGLRKLAKKYHMDHTTIRKILVDNQIEIKPRTPQKIDLQKAISMYNSGISTYKIAKIFKMTPRCVLKSFYIYGVKIRPKCFRNRKHKISPERLMNLQEEISSYWMGFLLADGHVYKKYNKIGCWLGIRDIGHLYQLAKDLNSDYYPHRKLAKRASFHKHKDFWYGYIIIQNAELREFYIKNNWFEFKKGDMQNFKPKNLNLRHFLRGFWDGDGIVSYKCPKDKKYLTMGVCDINYSTIEWIREQTVNLVYKKYKIQINRNKINIKNEKNTCYSTNWSGKQAVLIARLLYTNCMRYLPRKMDKIKPYLFQKS